MSRSVMRAIATVLGAVPLLAGCGAGGVRPPMGKVSGKVTYQGQPVTGGSVIFTPVRGRGGESGQVATGTIESDGSYTLTTFDTGDGAILGQHVVTVEARGMSSEEIRKMNTKPDGTLLYKLPKPVIPEKYTKADTSPLRYTVEAGSKQIDLELKD